MICAVCSSEFPKRDRGGNAKTCSSECSLEWKRSAQRMRRVRYMGKCADCGRPTDGSNGYGKASKRCNSCAIAYRSTRARWTQENIIRAIQKWSDEHGSPPSSDDWRVSGGQYPPTSHVQRKFGSWSEAIRQAGFVPRRPGERKK